MRWGTMWRMTRRKQDGAASFGQVKEEEEKEESEDEGATSGLIKWGPYFLLNFRACRFMAGSRRARPRPRPRGRPKPKPRRRLLPRVLQRPWAHKSLAFVVEAKAKGRVEGSGVGRKPLPRPKRSEERRLCLTVGFVGAGACCIGVSDGSCAWVDHSKKARKHACFVQGALALCSSKKTLRRASDGLFFARLDQLRGLFRPLAACELPFQSCFQ